MNQRSIVVALFCFIFILAFAVQSHGEEADLYTGDNPLDNGIEPNPHNIPMWTSNDIWVRNSADPNYNPKPFPTNSPDWLPLPHEDPEFDDFKLGVPAYTYVRVPNRSLTDTSSGTERLWVYWTKASSGLGWPNQWVDYESDACGLPKKLHGMEVTKPRMNSALVSEQERTAYIDALLDIDSNELFKFSDCDINHRNCEYAL